MYKERKKPGASVARVEDHGSITDAGPEYDRRKCSQGKREGKKGKKKIERKVVTHRLLKACSENSGKTFAIYLSALFPYLQNVVLRTD